MPSVTQKETVRAVAAQRTVSGRPSSAMAAYNIKNS